MKARKLFKGEIENINKSRFYVLEKQSSQKLLYGDLCVVRAIPKSDDLFFTNLGINVPFRKFKIYVEEVI